MSTLIAPYRRRIGQFCTCFACAICILSCSNTDSSANKKTKEVDTAFLEFLAKFPLRSYPISIRGCSINIDDLPALTGQKYIPDGASYHAYGCVLRSDDIICVIALVGADCEIPTIFTFDRNGNIIDKKEINIGNCGSDCGFVCNEIMQLRGDNTIFTADTISSYTCDSLGNAIPGTEEHYTLYKTGHILKTGMIELSAQIRKELQ